MQKTSKHSHWDQEDGKGVHSLLFNGVIEVLGRAKAKEFKVFLFTDDMILCMIQPPPKKLLKINT